MADSVSSLTENQRRALQVLGHLFLRMGQLARVRKLVTAMLALNPEDAWARRCMAVVLLKEGEAERALTILNGILEKSPLPSRDAVLHLLKAQALWQTGRNDEARNAVNAYLAAGGNPL